MKQALFDIASGLVLQWRDTALYEYATPPQGMDVVSLSDDFDFPGDAPRWVRNGAVSLNAPPPPPLALEVLAAQLDAAVTAKRWKVETGGITLDSGVRVSTGKDDQDRITSTIAGMEAVSSIQAVDFKAASGWVTLTLGELQAVRAAVALHVQACFSAERAHHEAIASLAATEGRAELEAYDIESGWPS